MSRTEVEVKLHAQKNRKPHKKSDNEDVQEGPSEPSPGMESDATYDSDENAFLFDSWILTAEILTREHNQPRTELFCPDDDTAYPSPIPVRYLDIMRRTTTSAPMLAEAIVEDFWVGPADANRELSAVWFVRTMFPLLKPKVKPGYEWANGRLTRRTKTSKRPSNTWPEMWSSYSDNMRVSEIAFKEKERVKRERV